MSNKIDGCNCDFSGYRWILANNCCKLCRYVGELSCEKSEQLMEKEKENRVKQLMYKYLHCEDCLSCSCDWIMRLKTGEQGCYMIKNDIWLSGVGVTSKTVLCEDCFEKRLGKPLFKRYYTDAPVNIGH